MGGKRALRLFIPFLGDTRKRRPNHVSHTRLEDLGTTEDKGCASPIPNFQGPRSYLDGVLLALAQLQFHLNAGCIFKIRPGNDGSGVTDPAVLTVT